MPMKTLKNSFFDTSHHPKDYALRCKSIHKDALDKLQASILHGQKYVHAGSPNESVQEMNRDSGQFESIFFLAYLLIHFPEPPVLNCCKILPPPGTG